MANLPCPPELWPAFSALLDQALEVPEGERTRWLAALGPENDAVRPWLAQVLAVKDTGGSASFLRTLVMADEPALSDFSQGQHVGPYLLERLLGRGGMGEVWLASRSDGTLNRHVALKLPLGYLLAGVLRQRFEREKNILAALSHPNIAQLYDAGVADSQHPYLAMEWVDGTAISQHCEAHKLSLQQRLDLFAQVLEAVGYAHERLIAHRDLKPSNILVTREGKIKLLDFGIAKLLSDEAAAQATQLTQAGGHAATPDYAAPEQLRGEPITVAVDLYALGVILYELLTGQRPFKGARKPLEARKDAPRASTQVDAAHAANTSGMDLKHLRRALSGDLDAIIAKAMEASPQQRYRSTEAFARDLHNSRHHLPISARRISALSLGVKFVQRHRLAVTMTASLLLALIAGTVGIYWQSVRAEREAERATAAKDFLIGMFRASDPSIASDKPRGTITARELMDANAAKIEQHFANDPDTEIDLLGVTSEIYRALDETERYKAQQHRFEELALSHYGPLHPTVIKSRLTDAWDASRAGDRAEQKKIMDDIDGRLDRAGLDESALRGQWWLLRDDLLSTDYHARGQRAEALDHAIPLLKAYAPKSADLMEALERCGWLSLLQDPAKASQYFRQAVALAGELQQPNDGLLQQAYDGLAEALWGSGDFEGAQTAYITAIDFSDKTYGPHNRLHWHEMASYAHMLHDHGDRERSLKLFADLDHYLPAEASGYRDARDENQGAYARFAQAICLAEEGRPDLAIPLVKLVEQMRASSSRTDSDELGTRLKLGDAYARAGQFEEARSLLKQVFDAYEKRGTPPDDIYFLSARERWARFLISQGEGDEAERQVRIVQSLQRNPALAVRAFSDLAQVALLRGDAKAALANSQHGLDVLANAGFHNVRYDTFLWRVRSQALLASGEAIAAREWAQKALDADRIYDDPASADIAADEAALDAARQGRPPKAVAAPGRPEPGS